MLSKKDCIKEANRQLNESIYYRKLFADPTSQYTTEVKQCVDSMYERKLIDKKNKEFPSPSVSTGSQILFTTKDS